MSTCPTCSGTGEMEYTCPGCNGSGEGYADGTTCRTCGGGGVMRTECEACGGTGEKEEGGMSSRIRAWFNRRVFALYNLAETHYAFEACRAALKYDAAIRSCADDPKKMSSFCMAQGEDLDQLYADWIRLSRRALGL